MVLGGRKEVSQVVLLDIDWNLRGGEGEKKGEVMTSRLVLHMSSQRSWTVTLVV